MRLLYSGGSPFARIIRIALLETGLDTIVSKKELTRSQLYSSESDVLALNPVGRVPTLELDDGTVLTESKLILDYIDALNTGPKLLPRDGSDRWRTLAELGQALGLLESVTLWLRARSLPEQQRPLETISRETERVNRAAHSLDKAIAGGAYGGTLNAAQIALGTALGVAEKRLLVWKWRQGRSSLSDWYDAIAERPSFQMTEPPFL
jgi:glutathione S-transferase